MSISSFNKYQNARQRAKARANEVIEDMRKQTWCQDIEFDKVVTPKMREQLEQQHYEIEKAKDNIKD